MSDRAKRVTKPNRKPCQYVLCVDLCTVSFRAGGTIILITGRLGSYAFWAEARGLRSHFTVSVILYFEIIVACRPQTHNVISINHHGACDGYFYVSPGTAHQQQHQLSRLSHQSPRPRAACASAHAAPAMPAATRLCPPSKRHHASFSLYTRSTSLAAPEATPPSHGETPTPLTTTFSPIWYLAVRMR